mgnify:CR=1 FL=1
MVDGAEVPTTTHLAHRLPRDAAFGRGIVQNFVEKSAHLYLINR